MIHSYKIDSNLRFFVIILDTNIPNLFVLQEVYNKTQMNGQTISGGDCLRGIDKKMGKLRAALFLRLCSFSDSIRVQSILHSKPHL